MKKFLVGLIVFITIIASILIQINILNVITFAGTAANIGIVLIVSIALMCGDKPGVLIGGIYGLLQDIISRKINWFLYTIIYMFRIFFRKNRKRIF